MQTISDKIWSLFEKKDYSGIYDLFISEIQNDKQSVEQDDVIMIVNSLKNLNEYVLAWEITEYYFYNNIFNMKRGVFFNRITLQHIGLLFHYNSKKRKRIDTTMFYILKRTVLSNHKFTENNSDYDTLIEDVMIPRYNHFSNILVALLVVIVLAFQYFDTFTDYRLITSFLIFIFLLNDLLFHERYKRRFSFYVFLLVHGFLFVVYYLYWKFQSPIVSLVKEPRE